MKTKRRGNRLAEGLVLDSLIFVVVGGLIVAFVVYVIKFRIEKNRWPLQEKVKILCESTSEKDTYEIPYYYPAIEGSIPIKIEWALGKPLDFRIKVVFAPDKNSKNLSSIDIGAKGPYNGDKLLDSLLLNEVAGEYVGFDKVHVGKLKSFEIVVDSDRLQCRKKVSLVYVPWSHTTELSSSLIYTGDTIDCSVKIKNNGAEGDFIVIYEVYKIANGRQKVWREDRIGIDKDNKNKIHVSRNKEVELKPQMFQFKDKGEYFIKTYVIKYQKYLMKDWDFWSKDRITIDEIGDFERKEQTELYNYPDCHKLTEIKVIDL